MVNLAKLSKAVVMGDIEATAELTEQAINAAMPAGDILDKGLIPGLQQVGDLFENGEYYLPELIVSGDAVAKALEFLTPILRKEGTHSKGKFLIGTVQGDVHDLGKNIVIMMLQGNGWEVVDLGVDVSAEQFCTEVAKGDYQILGMSALLTMTMSYAIRTIEKLKEAGLREKIKVMVGGAPTTPEWAKEIGADAHAKDGPSAAKVAAELIGKG